MLAASRRVLALRVNVIKEPSSGHVLAVGSGDSGQPIVHPQRSQPRGGSSTVDEIVDAVFQLRHADRRRSGRRSGAGHNGGTARRQRSARDEPVHMRSVAMIHARLRIVGVLIAVLFTAQSAAAWGREGHRVIARIAARNLNQTARKKVAVILATNDAGLEAAMAAASTWPDEIDKKKTGTDTWHFIDVPITVPFSITGLCPNHNCVLDRIAEMQNRLATNAKGFTLAAPPSPPRPMTSQEMAFLIHFVGDVHQPLHGATDGDRGGNCVGLIHPLVHTDGTKTTELHAVWDVDEVIAMANALGSESSIVATLF